MFQKLRRFQLIARRNEKYFDSSEGKGFDGPIVDDGQQGVIVSKVHSISWRQVIRNQRKGGFHTDISEKWMDMGLIVLRIEIENSVELNDEECLATLYVPC